MRRIHIPAFRKLLLICSCLLFFTCGSPDEQEIPAIADFTADSATPTGIVINCGECVVFEDRSSGDIGAWFWDFEGGDPATSDEDFRVSVCYKDPGKFDVSLSVNAGEDRITRAEYVCVLGKDQPLDASFSVSMEEIVEGQSISLTDESTGNPESWSWTIEGPGPIQTSSEQNPEFILDEPGVYSVSLVVTKGTEQDVEERIGYISVLKFLDFKCLITSSQSNTGLTSELMYNDLDQLIRLDEFFNGDPFGYNLYTWNNSGLVTRVENFDPSDIRIGRQEYQYNNEGIIEQQEFFDTSNASLAKYQFEIENGRITGGTLEQPIPNFGIFTSGLEYQYDANGNVREERFFTPQNGQTTQRITVEFDDKVNPFFDLQVEPWPARGFINNPLNTRFINADDEVFIERIHEYDYNEFGRPFRERRTSFGATTEFTWDFDCKKK